MKRKPMRMPIVTYLRPRLGKIKAADAVTNTQAIRASTRAYNAGALPDASDPSPLLPQGS